MPVLPGDGLRLPPSMATILVTDGHRRFRGVMRRAGKPDSQLVRNLCDPVATIQRPHLRWPGTGSPGSR